MNQANAAQIASRNIKQAKGRRKQPLRSDGTTQQSMSFNGGDGAAGGLFGGSVQAPGTFSFATQGAPSFPPTTFGNPFTNGASSDNEDPRADTTGEEALRRNKSFRGASPAAASSFGQGGSFGQAPAQGNSANSSFSFSSLPTTTSFGQNATQAASNSFSFNPQPSPSQPAASFVSNPFSGTASPSTNSSSNFFRQSSSQPTSSATSLFSSAPAQPAVDFFGSKASSTTSSNLFGGSTPAAPSTSNIFGNQEQKSSTAGNSFGGFPQGGQPNNPFGMSTGTQPTPTSNLFGPTPVTQSPSSSSIFSKPATSQPSTTSGTFTGFSTSATAAAPTTGINGFNTPTTSQPPASNGGFQFGAPTTSQPSTSDNSFFGNSAISQSLTSGVNGFSIPATSQPSTSGNNLFGATNTQAQASLFKFGESASSQAPSSTFKCGESSGSQAPSSNSTFGGFKSFDVTAPSTTSNTLFGTPNKPSDTQSTVSNMNGATQNPFGTISATPNSQSNIFGGLEKPKTPSTNLFGTLNKPLNEPVSQLSSDATKSVFPIPGSSSPSTSEAPAPAASSFFVAPKQQPSAPSTNSFTFGSNSATPEVNANSMASSSKRTNAPANGSQPSSTGLFPSLGQKPVQNQSLATVSTPNPSISLSNGAMRGEIDTYQVLNDSLPTDELLQSVVPSTYTEEQKEEFYTAYRLRSLNKAISKLLSALPVSLSIENILEYYNEKRSEIFGRSNMSFSSSKRKASDDGDIENRSSNKRSKPFEILGAASKASSGESSHTTSLGKPRINEISTPSLPAPSSSNTASLPSSSPKGQRKADKELTKDDFEKGHKRLAMNENSTMGSSTSNIFKNIVDSPEKKVKALPGTPKEDTPRANPFGNLPIPSSQTSTTESPAFKSTSNMFASQSAAPTANVFSAKPSTATANPFAPKAISASTNSSSAPPKSTITPPNFGSSTGPVNFFAQFGQQAKKDAAKSEKELMEKAKDEDYDSEDDGPVEAWEEKWKAKRKAELEELAELARTSKGAPTFVPTKASSTATGGIRAAENEKAKSIFDTPHKSKDSTPVPSSNADDAGTPKSIFDSVQSSRAATPSSNANPAAFDNPFAHLAQTSKPDEKDDHTDEESGDEDADGDAENRDPTLQSSKNKESASSMPGQASKGASVFSFLSKPGLSERAESFSPPASSVSSGGLFDRIQKDANGNPMRQLPSDEKENTEPRAGNLFSSSSFGSSFGKTSEVPADQTWKKDGPIRFGSATPNGESTKPSFNFTSATPTKPSAPFSNLFGNSTTPKAAVPSPAVGFNFSAPTSNLSSLLPSAAGSISTSRATTPGATTDGDSAAEGDPDAEKHAQINLTAGGPGEEDEDVLYEGRAKGNVWDTKDSKWVLQGVGLLKVLKHKDTGASRILLRADPSGKIVLNKSIISQPYEAVKKTVSFLTAADKGEELEKWILQVKTEDMAKDLASILESNKAA